MHEVMTDRVGVPPHSQGNRGDYWRRDDDRTVQYGQEQEDAVPGILGAETDRRLSTAVRRPFFHPLLGKPLRSEFARAHGRPFTVNAVSADSLCQSPSTARTRHKYRSPGLSSRAGFQTAVFPSSAATGALCCRSPAVAAA